jgi:AAA domain
MSDDIKFKLHRLSEYDKIPSTEFLVEPYLPLGGQIVLAALPKTLKTYVALSWACCVATGRDWLGHKVSKGKVLYFALESYHGVLRRKEAWRRHHGKSRAELDDLVCITVPINFAQENSITKALADLAAQQFRPNFIVIDTWFKSTAGAKVSDQAEMTEAIDQLTVFQRTLEAMPGLKEAVPQVTILIIAHTDKKGIDLFGSIAQFANCDVLYMLNRKDHALEVTLACVGARDIEEPHNVIIGLEKMVIETARGLEENLAVTKEIDVLECVLNTKVEDVAPDHDLARNALLSFGAAGAGYTQWLQKINADRPTKLSTSMFDPIKNDFVRRGEVIYDATVSNTWIDAEGKRRTSKGLYWVASLVSERGNGGDASVSTSTSTSASPLRGRSDRSDEVTNFEVTSKSRSSKLVGETESGNDCNPVEASRGDEDGQTEAALNSAADVLRETKTG